MLYSKKIPAQLDTDSCSWLASKCKTLESTNTAEKKRQILEEILAWLACKCKTMESTNTAQQKETNTCRNNGPAELRNWRCTSNRCSAATNASLKILAIENSCPHSDYSKKYTSFRVRAILKALEACKVKLSCFKGIVDPTHFR